MQWHPLNCAETSSSTCTITNLAYSGSSVAAIAEDRAKIVIFDFPAPPVLSNHLSLLAMIDSPRDPITTMSRSTFSVDGITASDNNVSYRFYPWVVKAHEICRNGVDDNDDGVVDEEPCEPPLREPPLPSGAGEICLNGVDDNDNGYVDEAGCKYRELEPEEP
jgi:hypothetical protein